MLPRRFLSFFAVSFPLLALLAGCGPKLQEPGKPSPPIFPLRIPQSAVGALPEEDRLDIEDVVRAMKRSSLYATGALLPALEIVRTHPVSFQRAAKLSGLDSRLFEGLIVLECGGRGDNADYLFMRGKGKHAHVGLGQIGWEEGRSVGLKVSPDLENRLKAEIRRSLKLLEERSLGPRTRSLSNLDAALFNSLKRQTILMSAWRAKDERFDMEKNLAATARLLRMRLDSYHGDASLAVASYHAGRGNIARALRMARKEGIVLKAPEFWSLYADRSGPVYQLMSGWSDSSRNYFPKALAAADIAEKYLNKTDQFEREYLYWGPEDAAKRLAESPNPALRRLLARSGG